ncbi:MAG TPA: chorismate-binding protein, partial [Thermoanaerobaculia bacterium]
MDETTLEQLRSDYDVIPIVRVLSADTITPVAAFAAIAEQPGEAFLLESVERGENLGRYSFIGFSPRRSLRFDRDVKDPIETLRAELVPLKVYGEESLPPFFGGAVGWFGYGVARWMERLPDRHRDDFPDAELLFFDNVIAFDHLKQRLFVIATLFTNDARTSAELIAAANATIERAIERLRGARIDLLDENGKASPAEFTTSCSKGEFIDLVRRAKEEIAAGEIFQIVLSRRWQTDFPTSQALVLYRALRSINPSPYMFLLRTKECTLVGASPEMLVRVHANVAETRPLAGTRPRGATREEDDALMMELLADPKENAEHLMLVDLGRNDIGRVAASGSVEVTEFLEVERYSHVMHLVSNVRGTLRDGMAPIDAFLSCFPAGTVSGA